MRKMLARLGFALLRRAGASLWWNTADVPGLFDPAWKGRMTFDFGTMRFYPPSVGARVAYQDSGFNFSHPCPPFCPDEDKV